MSAQPIKILFVDDEAPVLDGLRRMLRSFKDEWEMRFAVSGQEALEMLRGSPCDLIISDMRMPGMSGEQLLAKVRKLYPDTIRFVLSGQTDQADLVQSVGSIHQFLQKPCDSQVLRSAISRACRLRGRLAASPVRSIVSSLEMIPTLPTNYHKLAAELKNKDASATSIAQIIAQDIGMTAKVMQLVNSSFFGSVRRVSSPVEAVTRLGLRTISAITISLHLFDQFAQESGGGVSSAALWNRARVTAARTQMIARAAGLSPARAEAAYVPGLLHEAGRVVLSSRFGEEYAHLFAESQRQARPLHEMEQQYLGVRQGEVGGYLLGIWAFDDEVVDAVTFFESPSESTATQPSALTALHLAVGSAGRGYPEGGIAINRSFMDRIGQGSAWESWVRAAAA